MGTLHVTTVTTGVNLDPDGYMVVTRPQNAGRDSLSRPIGINETFVWDLEPTTHRVELSGVESNCIPSGNNPRSVTLAVGSSVSTTFDVNCTDQIAFATDRDGNDEIYLMNADGTRPLNLTIDPAYDRSPAWSPDASKVTARTS
jgi:hypothetical protein